ATETLAAGDARAISEKLIVVLRGTARIEVNEAGALMGTGDHWGELELLTGRPRAVTLTATRACEIATLDRAGLDAILAEFPADALPLAEDLASALHQAIDVSRELAELHAENLAPDQLASVLAARSRSRVHATRVRRLSARGLFRRLVVERGAEPPF